MTKLSPQIKKLADEAFVAAKKEMKILAVEAALDDLDLNTVLDREHFPELFEVAERA